VAALFTFGSHRAEAGIKLAWDPVPESDQITGYRIYYGHESGQYFGYVSVGKVVTYELLSFDKAQRWYFVATAYRDCTEDSFCGESAPNVYIPCPDGQICESGYSNEVVWFGSLPLATDGHLSWVEILTGQPIMDEKPEPILSSPPSEPITD